MYGVALSASIAVLAVMLASVTRCCRRSSPTSARRSNPQLRIPFLGRGLRVEGKGGSRPRRGGAHAVQRRPWTAAIAGTAVLLALAAPALGMRLGFPDAGNDPPDTMTRQAYDLNTEGFGPGTNGPLVIAAELPGRRGEAGDRLARGAAARRAGRWPSWHRPRINAAGDAAIVTVIPKGSPQDAETADLVKRLREDVRAGRSCAGSGITAKMKEGA